MEQVAYVNSALSKFKDLFQISGDFMFVDICKTHRMLSFLNLMCFVIEIFNASEQFGLFEV